MTKITDEQIDKEACELFPEMGSEFKDGQRDGYRRGMKAYRDLTSLEGEGSVYTSTECIFEYCPSPEICTAQDGCQNLK